MRTTAIVPTQNRYFNGQLIKGLYHKMRRITHRDNIKYGCLYCKDRIGKTYPKCQYDRCKYAQLLDKFGSYANYLQITRHRCKALLKFMGD